MKWDEIGGQTGSVARALAEVGDRWHDDGRGRPLEHVHRACGNAMPAEPACSACGERLDPRDVEVRPGPSLRAETASDRADPRP